MLVHSPLERYLDPNVTSLDSEQQLMLANSIAWSWAPSQKKREGDIVRNRSATRQEYGMRAYKSDDYRDNHIVTQSRASPEDRLGEMGALVVERGILTRSELEALASIGVDTPEALLALASDPERRCQIARQLDLSEADLIVAGVLAKFLTVQGPGAVLARQAMLEADLSSWADPQDHEGTENVLRLTPGDFVEMLTEAAEDRVKEHARAQQRRANRNEIRFWLILIVLTLVAQLLAQWNGFFRSTRGDAVLAIARDFVRTGVYINMGMALATVLGIVMLGKILGIISANVLPTRRLQNKYLSWRDRLIAIEAFTLLPPRLVKMYEWLQANFVLSSIVLVVVVVVAAVSRGWNMTGHWPGYAVLASLALLVLLVFWLQAQAFARLNQRAKWASPTQERFAEFQALSLPLAMGVSALLIYLAYLPALRIGLGALSNWQEHQQTLRMETFERSLNQLQFADDEQAEWVTGRPEWIAWGLRQVDTSLSSAQTDIANVLTLFDAYRRTLAVGLLGVLLAVALAEYLYASRPKGAAGLGVWVAALVASEYLPDRIAQAVGISEATATGVVLTLALAAFIGIMGELGMPGRGRRSERMCPNPACFEAVAADASYCPSCGTSMSPGISPNESLGR